MTTWKTVKRKHVWGSDSNTVKKVEKGDKAFVYVTKTQKGEKSLPPRIKGLFEVISDPYEDRERIFKGGTFPNRVKLQPEIVLEGEHVNFRDLIPELSFIKNKKYWTGYIRSGINDMPKEDYELIKEKLEKKKEIK